MREVYGSIPWPIKSDTVLPTARRPSDVSSVLPRRKAAGMGPTKSIHASAYCSEYNEDLIFLCFFRTECEYNYSKLNVSDSY